MHHKIIILDFGSQTARLIGRRIRELKVFCEIIPYNKFPFDDTGIQGVILSDSPFSVHDPSAFKISLEGIRKRYPVLGIGYGAQYMAYAEGGRVEPCENRDCAQVPLTYTDPSDPLFKDIAPDTRVRMSRTDALTVLPPSFTAVASYRNLTAAYKIEGEATWGVQFHSEVFHTPCGTRLLDNFLNLCGCAKDWTPASFVDETVAGIKAQIGGDRVILGLSGGVDSSVTAALLHKAIGPQLSCVFVDHGLLRKNEFVQVMESYRNIGLTVTGVDAGARFLSALAGVSDPERKRKIIGKCFIDEFNTQAEKIRDAKWLGQGTIYPDIIESLSSTGSTIKSHHNVGGLPRKMHLKLIEPLRLLFKDEVRKVGYELGMPPALIERHPFPGPGLGIRILGEVTPQKVAILQEADAIFIQKLHARNLYDKVWQAAAILLPVRSVGLMKNERTYENAIVLRAVTSVDAMTADWARLPDTFLAEVSNEIIAKVKGVNRVVYDISAKPPATIEWE